MRKYFYLYAIIVFGSLFALFFYIRNWQSEPQNILTAGLLIIVSILLSLLVRAYQKKQQIERQINQKIDFIQKAAGMGIWEWDIKNKRIHFSDTALSILGFDPAKPILKNAEFFYQIYKPDRARHLTALKSSINSGVPYKVEIRSNLSHQHKRWLASRGEIVFDENNQPSRMLGMHQDITSVVVQRQLQEKMKRIMQLVIDHESLDTIISEICKAVEEIESSVYCVVFLTSSGSNKLQLHHSNNLPNTLKHILKSITIEDESSELSQTLSQSEMLYIKNLDELPSWRSSNQLSNTHNIVSYCGQSLLSNHHASGGAICLYLQDSAIPIEIIHQILDISSGVVAVAIEGQHQTDSQQEIQQQLYHSQKMDSIGHLTGGIAHDFNNILGSIVGYNSLAKKIVSKEENDKLKQYLNEVSIAANRARDLISQMMIFSRMEPSKNVPVDARPVIKEVLQLVKSMIPSSIAIHHNLKTNISHISINPIALHQIVMNMLINAKDAAKNNVGKIFVHLYEVSLQNLKCSSCHEHFSGAFVCIEINDSGSGIPAELITKIFDPFFTTKKIGQGTGMGLSVVHGIIHDSHGHIEVTSSFGEGTIFKIYLPVLAQDQQGETIAAFISDQPINLGNGEHIMVVDDDVPLSLLFEEILNSYGYKVTRFDNSQLALECFLNDPNDFDLILSDQTMPFITGDEMAKKMLSAKADIPIIICTGYSEKLNAEQAEDIGITKLLAKPVDMYKLLDIIDATIKK